MRMTMALVLSLAAVSGASAQEAQQENEAKETQPRSSIKVLQHPYAISSFYRSGESPLGPWAGLADNPEYRIADFYRAPRLTISYSVEAA